MVRRFLVLLSLVLIGGTTLAQDMAELEVDHNTSSELITPHTDWATPYARLQAGMLGG